MSRRRLRRNPRFQDFGPADWDKFFKPGKPPMLPYAPLGSISEGTLRGEDLLHEFSWALDKLAHRQPNAVTRQKHQKLVRRADQLEKRLASLDEDENDDPDEANEEVADLLDRLSNALEEYAPPYGYFGASETDGADFGFWIQLDAVREVIREARRHPTDYRDELAILVVDDLDDVPDHFSGEVFLVNDHGNVTFFECSLGELVEIWSII